MKTFSRFFGTLPFAGKFAIIDLFSMFLGSPDQKTRFRRYVILLTLLTVYVWAHGSQAYMGYSGLFSNSPFWTKPIFITYFLANACATIVQIYLMARATSILFSRKYARRVVPISKYTPKDMLVAVVITLVGQIAFLIPFEIFVS